MVLVDISHGRMCLQYPVYSNVNKVLSGNRNGWWYHVEKLSFCPRALSFLRKESDFASKMPMLLILHSSYARAKRRRGFIEYVQVTKELNVATHGVATKRGPSNASISTRKWNQVIHQWRVRLRLSARGATLYPLLPP